MLSCAHSDQRARCAGRVDAWWDVHLQQVLTKTLVGKLAFVVRAVVDAGSKPCWMTRVLAFVGRRVGLDNGYFNRSLEKWSPKFSFPL